MDLFNGMSGPAPAVLAMIVLLACIGAALVIQFRNEKKPALRSCGHCGEAIPVTADSCQKCGVQPPQAVAGALAGNGNKFLYGTGASLVAYLLLEHRFVQEWTSVALVIGIGSALAGGAVATLLPTVRKSIYLPVGILVAIGVSTVLHTGLFFIVMTAT